MSLGGNYRRVSVSVNAPRRATRSQYLLDASENDRQPSSPADQGWSSQLRGWNRAS